VRHSEPVLERLAGWFFGGRFNFFTAGMTGKTHFLSSHFYPVTPYREQEPQVVAEQALHALALPEADDPSELLQNRESTL